MRYLFFDIECATCRGGKGKICSFGYVLTSKKFEILEKDDIIINPNLKHDEYDKYVVKNILTYPISEIELHETFDKHYDKISRLLMSKRNLVCGFGLDNDLRHINDECERYGLKPLVFKSFDVQSFYQIYSAQQNKAKLTSVVKELGIDTSALKIHNSRDDAEMTMLAMKSICFREKMSILRLNRNLSKSVNLID